MIAICVIVWLGCSIHLTCLYIKGRWPCFFGHDYDAGVEESEPVECTVTRSCTVNRKFATRYTCKREGCGKSYRLAWTSGLLYTKGTSTFNMVSDGTVEGTSRFLNPCPHQHTWSHP